MDSSGVYLSALTYLGSTMSSSFIRVLEGGKNVLPSPPFFPFSFYGRVLLCSLNWSERCNPPASVTKRRDYRHVLLHLTVLPIDGEFTIWMDTVFVHDDGRWIATAGVATM